MNSIVMLTKYEHAVAALADAMSVDEVKQIRDTSEAMRAYARQAKNKAMEIDAAEIRIRAERRLGEMMAAQREAGMMSDGGRPKETGLQTNPVISPPTLSEMAIDKNLADRARKLAAIPEQEYETIVSDWREKVNEENERVTVNLLASADKHIRGTFGTGENEWYTPDEFLDSARELFGEIELDPASSAIANMRVKSKVYYTFEDDGLSKNWFGKVWLNPPYAQPLISKFCSKVVSEYKEKKISESIILTHNYTDTNWFSELASAASALCFTKGRIRFIGNDGTLAAPTQGQVFTYLGKRPLDFAAAFEKHGLVVRPVR